MKLYEFRYIDKQNLPEIERLQRIERLLEREAEFQGWASGYQFRQCKEVQQSGDEQIFSFEVLGDYIDSDDIDPKTGQRRDESTPSLAARDVSP